MLLVLTIIFWIVLANATQLLENPSSLPYFASKLLAVVKIVNNQDTQHLTESGLSIIENLGRICLPKLESNKLKI